MAKKTEAKTAAPAAGKPETPAAPASPIERLRARIEQEIMHQQAVVPTTNDEKERRYGRVAALEDVLGWMVENPDASIYDGAIPPSRLGAWAGEPITRPKRRSLSGRSSRPAASTTPKRVKRQR